MKTAILSFSVVALVAGCSPRGDSTSSAAEGLAVAAAAPTTAAQPASVSLDCNRLVPMNLQSKYDLTELKLSPKGESTTASCQYHKRNDIVSVTYVCPGWDEKTFQATMDNGRKSMTGAKDVPGVGRTAYVGESHGSSILQFWDNDTPCYVTLAAPDQKTATGLAKDLSSALRPQAIKP